MAYMEHLMDFPYKPSWSFFHSWEFWLTVICLEMLLLFDWVGVLVEETYFSPWWIVMVMAHPLVFFMLHAFHSWIISTMNILMNFMDSFLWLRNSLDHMGLLSIVVSFLVYLLIISRECSTNTHCSMVISPLHWYCIMRCGSFGETP